MAMAQRWGGALSSSHPLVGTVGVYERVRVWTKVPRSSRVTRARQRFRRISSICSRKITSHSSRSSLTFAISGSFWW
ncbi:hypothetical protein ENSA7_05340 [Enhygromyxa salina]|uniref:Uncharacterized protein n=1 Tax=Enhygromyxa salina TaxID=215803 RepID=A0A2S9YXI7_9BACT|nr:hypothetical protein ENSA7_05340 [Enhygromyxa salina]